MVEEKQSLRIGDLAEREGVSAPTATRLVASLEEAGLLARTTDPADRRTAYVALTDAGREKIEWARGVRTASLVQRISAMPEADVRRLLELLPLLESFLVNG
jgi:DNA-binding MarR family transcriptional regulator